MTPLHASVDERERVLAGFLAHEQEHIARTCHALARAFASGGTLLVHGTGAAATDAAHVAVEFMHPVIVGKRALPALAFSNDATGRTGLPAVAGPQDVALGIAHGPGDDALARFVGQARERGLLSVALVGGDGGAVEADHVLAVGSQDAQVVQEVQETTYHVLWELVHVFFEHPGLLQDACITCGDVAVEASVVSVGQGGAVIERGGRREEVAVDLLEDVAVGDRVLCHAGVALERLPAEPDPTGFLYPFLDAGETDLDAVLADVRASTVRKGAEVSALRRRIDLTAVEACGRAIGERFERSGRVLAFGNGGSSTDAQDAAADWLARDRPALALTNDVATVTAVGNDVGYDNVFARQLIALGRAADVALAISTSGSSPNVIAGLHEAHRRGMLTCGLTGYDGGRLRELDWLDHLFVVPSDDIPRLQEVHATMYHLLVEASAARP